MRSSSTKEAKEGWRFAADAARITDERASIEEMKHTSGAVFVAFDSNVEAVVGEKQGAATSTSGNEETQAWVNVRGGVRVLQHTSGIRRDGPRETKPFWRRC